MGGVGPICGTEVSENQRHVMKATSRPAIRECVLIRFAVM